MTTESQIQANRLNALKSTGPKNAVNTSFNALKHGLLSKELCVKRKWINENPREYKQLLQFLLNDLKPTSVIESILVERIAQAYWRLRRVQRAEHAFMLANDRSNKYLFVTRTEEEKNTLNQESMPAPPMGIADTLGRYETMLEKQIYRAINQLEKMRQEPVKLQSTALELN